MDIRSIIDSEDHPPTRRSSSISQGKQEYRPKQAGFSGNQAPSYDNGREIRPPQPAPLQTQSYNDAHHPAPSPHDHLRSPYQRTPSSGFSNSQYSTSHVPQQSPHHGQQVLQYPQREGSFTSGPHSGRSFGHSTPLSQTPTSSTPGSAGAHSNFPVPTSSHSIPTPNSIQNHPAFPRESPQPSLTQTRTPSQPQGTQQYVSQPGTPLGPPTTYGRPVLNCQQDSPGDYRHRRSYSGSYHGQQEVGSLAGPGKSPPNYREQQHDAQVYIASRDRQQSLSVSPKTRLPSLPSIDAIGTMEAPRNADPGLNEHMTGAKRKIGQEPTDYEAIQKPKEARKPSRSVGVSGLLNAEPPGEFRNQPKIVRTDSTLSQEEEAVSTGNDNSKQSRQLHSSISFDQDSRPHSTTTQHSPVMEKTPNSTASEITITDSQPLRKPGVASSFKAAALKTSQSLIDAPLPGAHKKAREAKKGKRPMQESPISEVSEIEVVEQPQPPKKRPRMEESRSTGDPALSQNAQTPAQPREKKPPRVCRWQDVPIFAQSVRGHQRTKELFEQNLRGTTRGPSTTAPAPHATVSRPISQPNGTSRPNSQAPTQPSIANGVPASRIQQPPQSDGPLGPWEFTVTDTEPADEVTRILADFLFPHVVMNREAGVAPAGGGRGLGAVLEVEAKIGRLIDRNTNDRLHLPVLNECVINHADPNMRIAFESSMTEHQHRKLNQFLNKALVDSQQNPNTPSHATRKPRIPMTYKHTHEIDSFYDINSTAAQQLPGAVANGLQLNPNARHKAKVRITTDERTGEELAKIIKTRVADIDVYSPRSKFDWRISVNVEMDFDADVRELVAVEKRDGKSDRKKDRVSYKHLKYQIDLTQVTPAEPANKIDKEHELEIEVSSEEVRKQGLLAAQSQPNGYFDLIKGFVDNVRLLGRHCTE